MKGLILSGGTGSRLRPITYSYAKQLIPVANKPMLFYVLEDVAAAGIKEVGIVVGETKDAIKDAVKDGKAWGINVKYIEQDKPLGLAHAVKISESFIGDEPFLLYLGDNLLKGGIKIFVDEYGNNGEDIVVLLNEVEHPERFGVAEIDNQGQIKRLIEKPSQFISNKALVGIYIFNYKIFSAVKSIKPSWRRELEITDAIQYVIDHNGVVCPYIIQNWWKDTGKKEDVLEANRFILDYIDIDNKGNVDINSNIIGRVNIEVGSYVKNSIIHGPVLIGKDVLIEDAYIGPYTSIGDRVQIINSELEQSIIMEDACIIDVKFRIADSLIGRSVNINSKKKKPAILELIIGDQSQINMYNN